MRKLYNPALRYILLSLPFQYAVPLSCNRMFVNSLSSKKDFFFNWALKLRRYRFDTDLPWLNCPASTIYNISFQSKYKTISTPFLAWILNFVVNAIDWLKSTHDSMCLRLLYKICFLLFVFYYKRFCYLDPSCRTCQKLSSFISQIICNYMEMGAYVYLHISYFHHKSWFSPFIFRSDSLKLYIYLCK